MSATTLFLSLIMGSIGVAYFVYGHKQKQIVPFVSGVLLCALPYFISNVPILLVVGLIVAFLPYFVRH